MKLLDWIIEEWPILLMQNNYYNKVIVLARAGTLNYVCTSLGFESGVN